MGCVIGKLRCAKWNDVSSPKLFFFWCPACQEPHPYWVDDPDPRKTWQFNGDFNRPTFTPSLRVFGDGHATACHLNLTDGKIYYHGDSPHALAGETVELPDYPEA
ncbi:MAG: DUF6527 family protein [Isosphaeraceae bacterium]|nr:DUF6527 family protein [Isosphaeraceae bacterium]